MSHTAQRAARSLGLLLPFVASTLAVGQDKSELELSKARYQRVEAELRSHSTSHLDAAQKAERARLLDLLHEYWSRGEFGINRHFPGQRMPIFVDHRGTRCAVANLLDHSGRADLTDEVAKLNNYAWVVDLAGDARFLAWLDKSGLSLREAARIQGPRNWRSRVSRGFNEPPVTPAWVTRVEENARVAEDSARAGVPATRGAPSGTGRDRGGRTTRAPRSARLARTTLEEAIDWQDWWAVGKREFLRPRKLVDTHARNGETSIEVVSIERRAAIRKRLLPIVRAATQDRHAVVRASAARALGRLGDDSDIARLREQLSDAQTEIRADAILGLGALASRRSVHTLLHLIRDETRAGKGAELEPIAIVALGLSQRYGAPTKTGELVASLLRSSERKLSFDALSAAMMHQQLSPQDALDEVAGELAASSVHVSNLHALEALQGVDSRANVARLTRALSGRRQERRQSAAVALGHIKHDLALPALMTAYDLEREPLTRGLLALAVGRHGGSDARKLLLDGLRRGPRAMRTWNALGLALSTRRDPSAKVRRAIRAARKHERNLENLSGLIVASGIARDTESIPELVKALSHQAAVVRLSAAESLAMIRDSAARDALVERVKVDACKHTRALIAQILGYLGHEEDAAVITGILEDAKDTDFRAGLAKALGFLGNANACRTLERIIANASESPLVRASAIDGLACSVSEKPTFVLASLAAKSNFDTFPRWLQRAIWSTL